MVNGQLTTTEQFGNVVLRANADGSTVRLKDVARLNGKPSTGIGVQLSSSGNALATAKAVRARMHELEPFFPKGLIWSIPYDSSSAHKTRPPASKSHRQERHRALRLHCAH